MTVMTIMTTSGGIGRAMLADGEITNQVYESEKFGKKILSYYT